MHNVDVARFMCERLAYKGLDFICPHMNSAYMEDYAPYDYWVQMYHNILLRCDAVITCGLWQRSKGARAEIELAELNHIPVFHKFYDLLGWSLNVELCWP